MTLNRLKFLASTIEIYVKNQQQMLITTDPEIYGDYYQLRITEARQHLYQINQWIQQFEREVNFLESCLKAEMQP